MLDEYPIDPALNKNLVFAYRPPPEIDTTKLPILAEDWLDDLKKIIFSADSELSEDIFDRHVGETSEYFAKTLLLDYLKLFYHRLKGNLDSELGKLSTDKRQDIISKLIEEIQHCSEGFHNRVNMIVDSFLKPRNLAELLYIVRKKLIEEVAATLTNEVHAWNRVSIIAANDGLGVKANFPDDTYSGNLPDISIRHALQQTFHKNFIPFHLPCLLTAAFMELIPELESEKNNENGICLQTQEKITHLIKRFLPKYINERPKSPNNWENYFIKFHDNENSVFFRLVNLNWEKIYRSFYTALSAQGYFTDPQINSLIDSAYSNIIGGGGSSYTPAKIISEFFENKRYPDLLDQLEELNIRFPNYYQEISHIFSTKDKYLPFLDHLKQKFQISNDYPSKVIVGFQLFFKLDLDRNRKSFLIGEITEILLLKNKAGFNLLMLAAQYNPTLTNDILTFLKKNKASIDIKSIEEMILMQNENNSNALMIAASKQAEVISAILNFLTTIGHLANDTLAKLFTQQQKDNYTAVSLTVRDHPDRLKNILSFISNHIKIDRNTLRKLLFSENSNGACTALMLAVKNQSEATRLILEFISKNIKNFDSEILRKMFLEKDQDGFTILMLAVKNQAKATYLILEFISKNTKKLDPEILRKMFLEKDKGGFTILMLAARYQPKALEFLLTFINDLHHFFPAENLPALFLEENLENNNCLMLASKFQPPSVFTILYFINQRIESHPNIFSSSFISQLLLAHNKNRISTLMIASQHQLKAVQCILNFIQEHAEIFSPCFFHELLLASDQYGVNALMTAATYHCEVVNLLLDFLASNINHFNNDAIYEFVFKKIHDKEAAMAVFFGGRYNYRKSVLLVTAQLKDPTAINALLGFIDDHIELIGVQILTELLTEKDKQDNYIFGPACSRYPFTMKKVLNFIAEPVNNNYLAPIQDLLAYFIFEQLASWSLKTDEDNALLNKVILNCSEFLLIYFNKDYFVKQPNNLKVVTDELFNCYLDELKNQKRKNINYTPKFSFFKWPFTFKWPYSTTQKLEAAQALEKVVTAKNSVDKGQALVKLKNQYSALSEPRLGNFFAAYQEIDKSKADEAYAFDLENHIQHLNLARVA